MAKIILLKGLPGSGKSTWARQYVNENQGKVKRINKDDLRGMLDNNYWESNNEKFIIHIRNVIIIEALKLGKDVIVDDTNLHPKHEKYLAKLANQHHATLEIKTFFDISIEECIARDAKRPLPVGEKSIREMYQRYLV